LALAVAVVVSTSSTPAGAATYSVMAVGANGRVQPTMSASAMGWYGAGSQVIMVCWLDAERVEPPTARYSSRRWFVVQTPTGGWRTWVHSSWVDHQIRVRMCNSTNPTSA
jgi:hypothetical protein